MAVPAAATLYCPSRPATEREQIAIFDEFINKFYFIKNASLAFGEHVDVNYIQHNPNALSGRQVAIDFLQDFLPTVNNTIFHKAFSNNFGYLHYRLDMPNSLPNAVVDIVRFDGTCIMEHWDVVQERQPNATNPLALW